jgi:non-ribosomal peptide synthetase component E (peptide arylation enzyme)
MGNRAGKGTARVDDDGFVWIEGRLGDLINRGGSKVFPDEVEKVLCLSAHVREAAGLTSGLGRYRWPPSSPTARWPTTT